MGMEELSSDSEDGSGQPSHIARYEQWLEQKATRPPSPPPPPRTSESRTGLAKEPASSTTNSGPAEEQPGKDAKAVLKAASNLARHNTAQQHAATQTFPMPLNQDAVTGEMVAEGAEFPSKLAFQSTLVSFHEKINRRIFVTRSDLTNFTATCKCKSGCGFGISAGVQEKGRGGWRVSKFSPHSLSCTGLPTDANAHALTSSMVAPVVYDIYRADPKKTSWKTVQTLIGPYLASAPEQRFCVTVLGKAKGHVNGDPDHNIKLLPSLVQSLLDCGHYASACVSMHGRTCRAPNL